MFCLRELLLRNHQNAAEVPFSILLLRDIHLISIVVSIFVARWFSLNSGMNVRIPKQNRYQHKQSLPYLAIGDFSSVLPIQPLWKRGHRDNKYRGPHSGTVFNPAGSHPHYAMLGHSLTSELFQTPHPFYSLVLNLHPGPAWPQCHGPPPPCIPFILLGAVRFLLDFGSSVSILNHLAHWVRECILTWIKFLFIALLLKT